MKIDSRNFSWSEVEIRVAGRLLTAIQGISLNNKKEFEYLYGKGDQPLAIKGGNESTDGSITVLQGDLELLKDQAPDGNLTRLRNVDIQAAFSNDGGAMVRYSITGVQFTENQIEINQNDKQVKVQVPFMALGLKRA